jgi:hypothetical protein
MQEKKTGTIRPAAKFKKALMFEKVIKHLFYIIFCDFNFCGPELTAEYRRN